MARDQATISVSSSGWTQLTNADVSSITFQVIENSVYIRFTTDTTEPTEDHGIYYAMGQGELNRSISDMTNLVGADRVWAKCTQGGEIAEVIVDHA